MHQERIDLAGGGDYWWGKNQSWIKCVDARNGAELWSREIGRHVMSTPAVTGELVFIADTSRVLHCLDAETGESHWTQEANGDFWASPYVADGKVHIGTRRGDFWIFKAAPEKQLVHRVDIGAPISATVVAANQTLYLATMFDLFAIAY